MMTGTVIPCRTTPPGWRGSYPLASHSSCAGRIARGIENCDGKGEDNDTTVGVVEARVEVISISIGVDVEPMLLGKES